MITDFYQIASSGEPATDPVTLDEAKAWLRIRTTADDSLLTALITSVTLFGEKFTNRVFVKRTIEGFFSGLSASKFETAPFIQLRRAPLISVDAVEVLVDGSYTAFTDFEVKNTNGFPRVLFANGIFDANPDTDTPYPLKITFQAGYGVTADVPNDIKTALKAHIAFLYENRGDVLAEGSLSMPLETKSIYSGKYQIINTFG